MDNPTILVPYIIMAINVVALTGILTYAVYCALGKSCKVSTPGELSTAK